MTQVQLGRQIGVTKSTISAYENGERNPSYENLIILAGIFQVSTDFLLGVDHTSDTCLDLSGLSDSERAAVKEIIKTLRG
jgi:transcriptional regulator with XRE-family HTH domain